MKTLDQLLIIPGADFYKDKDYLFALLGFCTCGALSREESYITENQGTTERSEGSVHIYQDREVSVRAPFSKILLT